MGRGVRGKWESRAFYAINHELNVESSIDQELFSTYPFPTSSSTSPPLSPPPPSSTLPPSYVHKIRSAPVSAVRISAAALARGAAGVEADAWAAVAAAAPLPASPGLWPISTTPVSPAPSTTSAAAQLRRQGNRRRRRSQNHPPFPRSAFQVCASVCGAYGMGRVAMKCGVRQCGDCGSVWGVSLVWHVSGVVSRVSGVVLRVSGVIWRVSGVVCIILSVFCIICSCQVSVADQWRPRFLSNCQCVA